ncbi:hypothetical protein AAVH_29680 [Aphelenchoides avenae]|nr:hypothetical protein AAVH_29680 [Aphelenchus avenae]
MAFKFFLICAVLASFVVLLVADDGRLKCIEDGCARCDKEMKEFGRTFQRTVVHGVLTGCSAGQKYPMRIDVSGKWQATGCQDGDPSSVPGFGQWREQGPVDQNQQALERSP